MPSPPLSGDDAKRTVTEYYDAVAADYHRQYTQTDPATWEKYPQNHFRMVWLAEQLRKLKCESVYEVGVGEGTPLATLAGMGLRVAGCDLSEKMVAKAKERLAQAGVDPACIQWGDVEDRSTLSAQLEQEAYDAVVAFGVLPHVHDDAVVLDNMSAALAPGGTLFLEFRNKVFSLFTFNRHTKTFVLDDLLAGVSDDLKNEVAKELDARLAMDQPPLPQDKDGRAYDAIPAKYHNPFEMPALLQNAGFTNVTLHGYHFHAAPPLLEKEHRQLFFEESAKMELRAPSWRDVFLCSAMVAVATAP